MPFFIFWPIETFNKVNGAFCCLSSKNQSKQRIINSSVSWIAYSKLTEAPSPCCLNGKLLVDDTFVFFHQTASSSFRASAVRLLGRSGLRMQRNRLRCHVCVQQRAASWWCEVCGVAGGQAVSKQAVSQLSSCLQRQRGEGRTTPDPPGLFLHCLHSSGLVTGPAY